MTNLATIDQYIQDNQQSHIDQLCELLRIPSLSADPAFAPQLGQAATLVANYLRSNGFDVQVFSEYGPPVIYAESPKVPGAPVALVYGHYDVQPPDPLDQWVSPPFEPQIRNGNLYARGATDDKGQLMTHLHSVAAWRATGQPLPMQVKFLIEGEEEFGSAALEKFLAERADLIASDVIVISDSSQFGPGKPAITYGLRGIAYFELRVHGPKQDLHSGSFGGAVTNPAIVLTKILSSMTDPQGRIQLPGFYNGVVELQESEREMWRGLGFDEAKFCQQLAVDGLSGEAGFSTLERRWARPTFDINGLFGGYQGEGGKTIIPAMAGAKFSFRLVPNQDPKQVADQLRAFLAGHQYPGVRLKLIDMHGGPGVVTNPNGPFMAAAQQAVEIGFGTQAVLIREGGSIPIVAEMVHKTGADVLLLGWGLDDDNAHSPNEKFCVADYYKGIRASCHLWHHLASVKKQ